MTSTMRAAIAAVALAIAAPAALAQGSTEKGIEAYRQALQDGNPAELWEARGEDLWKKRSGPKNASLEKCDLGLGPGVVKGAYAQMPRHFADGPPESGLKGIGCVRGKIRQRHIGPLGDHQHMTAGGRVDVHEGQRVVGLGDPCRGQVPCHDGAEDARHGASIGCAAWHRP